MSVFLKILIVVFLVIGIIGFIILISDYEIFSGFLCLFIFIQLAILFYIPHLAMSKGYSGGLAFLLALFVPLFGSLIIIALLPNQYETIEAISQVKDRISNINQTPKLRCKRCKKEIADGYTSCPSCGSIDVESI